MNRPLAVCLALLLALAGCSAPGYYPTGGPPDPAGDTVGWERGIWHDEALPVTADDGLNESERMMVVARASARVEHLRGVEFDEPVTVELLSRSAYRERVLANGSGDGGPTDADRLDNARYEALFLVGERADSGEQRRETQATQVLGFYSPSEDRIVVISESETPVLAETTLGHELLHAYQFRHFDPPYNRSTLESKNTDLGLIEGDASLLDYRYEQRCGEDWRCVRRPPADASGSAGAASVHRGLSVLNYFPYSDGPVFVRTLQERGGWEAVNDAYDDPPASAEQVISPGKYGRDDPIAVRVENRNGSAWRRVTPKGPNYGSFGMPAITTMFAYPSYDGSREGGVIDPETFLNDGPDADLDPIDYNTTYAAGWEGDRMAAYVRDDGELGYVWRTAWESDSEAREFAGGYRELLRYWGGERVEPGVWRIPEGESDFADAFAVRVEGSNVTVTNAPSADALAGVNADARGAEG
jgi:hypothetical protein